MPEIVENGKFYGRVLDSASVAGITLSETTYRAGTTVPEHAHEHPFFCLVLQGGFIERSSSRGESCDVGSLLYHPENESHSHQFTGSTSRCFTVQPGADWIARLQDYPILPEGYPRIVRGGKTAWLATQLYQEFRLDRGRSPLCIEAYVLAVLGELSRRPGSERLGVGRKWFKEAREILDARFADRINLVELAGAVGVHPVHLSRAFRQELGCTLTQYVRHLRVDHACRRLIGSDDSLAAIGLAAGFSDQVHFTRRFKEVMATTPGEYRLASRRHAGKGTH